MIPSDRMKSNHLTLISVSRRPLSGIGVGRTTSNALMRSVATISRRGEVPAGEGTA